MTPEPPKPQLLVVDDAPENVEVLAGILRGSYQVKVALNGPKALQLAQSAPRPELILLDVMMPEMDGHEVCRRLKAQAETRDIPVIIVSILADESDPRLDTAFALLPKPIDRNALRRTVSAALQAGGRTSIG